MRATPSAYGTCFVLLMAAFQFNSQQPEKGNRCLLDPAAHPCAHLQSLPVAEQQAG